MELWLGGGGRRGLSRLLRFDSLFVKAFIMCNVILITKSKQIHVPELKICTLREKLSCG